MSTLKATNIKNDSSASNNIVLDSSGGVVVSGVTTVSAGSASAPSITPSGDSNTGIFFPSSDTIAFAEGGTEVGRFDSSGRFGVGTATPSGLFDARGFSYLSGIQIRDSSHVAKGYVQGDSRGLLVATDGAVNIAFDVNATERARIDSSGRLLIGTSSARTNFFNTNYSSTVQIEGAGTGINAPRLSIVSNTNSSVEGPTFILARANGTTVGSTTVVSNGDYLGGISYQGSDGTEFCQGATINAFVDGTPGADDMPGRLVFSTTADGASSPTERMRIANDGKMGFGTATLTGKFNFDGSVFLFSQPSGAGNSTLKFNTSTGAVTYDTSSRLVKENIEDCPYGLVELAQLKPRKYFRTDDQKVEIGFVADEVADVLPEFVPIGPKHIITKNEADTEEIPLGVNYEKLTAVLTKALQEAIGEIESLKARVVALETA